MGDLSSLQRGATGARLSGASVSDTGRSLVALVVTVRKVRSAEVTSGQHTDTASVKGNSGQRAEAKAEAEAECRVVTGLLQVLVLILKVPFP
jgi:hypothetical protein